MLKRFIDRLGLGIKVAVAIAGLCIAIYIGMLVLGLAAILISWPLHVHRFGLHNAYLIPWVLGVLYLLGWGIETYSDYDEKKQRDEKHIMKMAEMERDSAATTLADLKKED